MSDSDLTSHTAAYLTVSELAQHLHVSRRQILKQIQTGALPALRFGPRIYRIHVDAARDFERRSLVHAPSATPQVGRTPILQPIRAGREPGLSRTA
jgi:excisionase family DNA binding protein